MEYIRPSALPAPVFYDKLGERVALMKMIPGADCGMLSYLLEHNDAVIIESFGVGGLPSYQAAASSASCVRPWSRKDHRHDDAGAERGQQSVRL